jgi:hypothetical protein
MNRLFEGYDNADVLAANSKTWTPGAPTGGQKYIVVVCGTSATTHVSVDSITGTNGWNATFTLLHEGTLNSAVAYSLALYEVVAASSVAGNIVVSFDGDATGNAIIIDTDATLPTGATCKVQAADGNSNSSATASVGAMAAWTDSANLGYLAVVHGSRLEAIVPEGGGAWAMVGADASGNNPNLRIGSAVRTGEDTTPTATWTTAARFVAVALELDVDTGGGASAFSNFYQRRFLELYA